MLLFEQVITESSAYKILSELRGFGRSLMYTRNRNGSRTLTCGTRIVI